MKIGIYGGTFNPIHNGHVNIARYVLKEFKLDKIIVIPVGIPSHKSYNIAPANLRLKMCELAFKHDKNIIVSNIEIDNNDKVSYTIETLEKIKAKYSKETEFYEILGEDSAENFTSWKEYEKILKLAKVLVFKRKGTRKSEKNSNFIYLDTPIYDVSSTLIRDKVKNGENIENLVPISVLKLIKDSKLYKE